MDASEKASVEAGSELLWSNTDQLNALWELLDEKGIISQEESSKKIRECEKSREEFENSTDEETKETQERIRKVVLRELSKEPRNGQEELFQKFIDKAFSQTKGYNEARDIVFDEHGADWEEDCDD